MAEGGSVANFPMVKLREKSKPKLSTADSAERRCYSLESSPFGYRYRRRISHESTRKRRTLKDTILRMFAKRSSSAIYLKNYQEDVGGDEHTIVSDLKRLKSRHWKHYSKTVRLTIANAKSIPKEVQNCRRLVYFHLKCSDVKELPLELCLLEGIQELHLSSNNIQKLTHIDYCKNLRVLDVSQNRLTEIEGSIYNLKKLATLNLSGNSLLTLPVEICRLYGLQELFLSSNRLRSIPYGIENIRTLKYLDFSRNRIDLIREDFFENLKCLECFMISDNQLSGIPDSISNCKKLSKLYLRGNRLQFVPSSFSGLDSLEMLNLSKNHIEKYTVAIPSLKRLYLGSNDLSEISNAITASLELTYLSLENNNLSAFPKNVLKCLKLRGLNLKNNRDLSVIPKEINCMKELRQLNLETTRTSRLSLQLLSRVKRLSVSGSLFSSEFQEMSDAGIETLREFIASKQCPLPDLIYDCDGANAETENEKNDFKFEDCPEEDDEFDFDSEDERHSQNQYFRCRKSSVLRLS